MLRKIFAYLVLSKLLRKQKNKKQKRYVCCWSEHNNMERGSSTWIPWDNFDEIQSKGRFAGLGQHRMPRCPDRWPFLSLDQERLHAFLGSRSSSKWFLTHYMQWNKIRAVELLFNQYYIEMPQYILIYIPPPTAILSNSNAHWKYHHPLVIGSQDHHGFANESEKATLLQLKVT